jgi:hypothetical protein
MEALRSVAFSQGYFIAVGDIPLKPFISAYISADGLEWDPLDLPNLASVISASNNAFWLTGSYGFVAKGRIVLTSAVTVHGFLNTTGEFVLTIDAPTAGTFHIFSSGSILPGLWEEVAVFPNSGTHLNWTDNREAGPIRFYKVQQE